MFWSRCQIPRMFTDQSYLQLTARPIARAVAPCSYIWGSGHQMSGVGATKFNYSGQNMGDIYLLASRGVVSVVTLFWLMIPFVTNNAMVQVWTYFAN